MAVRQSLHYFSRSLLIVGVAFGFLFSHGHALAALPKVTAGRELQLLPSPRVPASTKPSPEGAKLRSSTEGNLPRKMYSRSSKKIKRARKSRVTEVRPAMDVTLERMARDEEALEALIQRLVESGDAKIDRLTSEDDESRETKQNTITDGGIGSSNDTHSEPETSDNFSDSFRGLRISDFGTFDCRKWPCEGNPLAVAPPVPESTGSTTDSIKNQRACGSYTGYAIPIFREGHRCSEGRLNSEQLDFNSLAGIIKMTAEGPRAFSGGVCGVCPQAAEEIKMNGSGICISRDGHRAQGLSLVYTKGGGVLKGRHGLPYLRAFAPPEGYSAEDMLGGITSSGLPAVPWYTAAGNRKIYGKATLVYISDLRKIVLPDGTTHSGYVVVHDTGSAFKGAKYNRLDLHMGNYHPKDPQNPFPGQGLTSSNVCKSPPIVIRPDPKKPENRQLIIAAIQSMPAKTLWKSEVLKLLLPDESSGTIEALANTNRLKIDANLSARPSSNIYQPKVSKFSTQGSG